MSLQIYSYGAAAVAYGLLTWMLLVSRQTSGAAGRWLVLACSGAALWGLAGCGSYILYGPGPSVLTYGADAIRALLLTWCFTAALPPDQDGVMSRRALALSAAVLAAVAFGAALFPRSLVSADLALLSMAVVGCLAVEQIFRNSAPEQKKVLKWLVWTLVVVWSYDLMVFADAVLFDGVDSNLWLFRGVVATVAAPLFLLSAKTQPEWTKTLFISRHVVFYSATLAGVGLYLIAMSIAAALIRENGGQWAAGIQLVFLVAAIGVLAGVLSSARLRSLARLFISKHFFRHRYEYRDEWLRLIRTLSGSELELPMEQRCIKALAQIIQSSAGQLWLRTAGSQRYEPFAAWQAAFPAQEFPADSALVRFLREQAWIIDTDQYDHDPERYNHALHDARATLPRNSIIVPLIHDSELLGFVSLARPGQLQALNYEDHDLLKTAGRQVAAFLAHDLAQEQLAETRQFEAFNKLSAFVMHDLKNLVAQQTMLVENARKHQHKPEFVADVVRTVDHGVARMRRMLQQLEQRATAQPQSVDLRELVARALADRANGCWRAATVAGGPVWVRAPREELGSVVSHLLVNAEQATAKGGSCSCTVSAQEGKAIIDICDTGEGMSEEFVRRRLFKPFDTTKGSAGMGIGAYQAREVVRALGGDIIVASEIGKGTTVRLVLPVWQRAAQVSSVSG